MLATEVRGCPATVQIVSCLPIVLSVRLVVAFSQGPAGWRTIKPPLIVKKVGALARTAAAPPGLFLQLASVSKMAHSLKALFKYECSIVAVVVLDISRHAFVVAVAVNSHCSTAD